MLADKHVVRVPAAALRGAREFAVAVAAPADGAAPHTRPGDRAVHRRHPVLQVPGAARRVPRQTATRHVLSRWVVASRTGLRYRGLFTEAVSVRSTSDMCKWVASGGAWRTRCVGRSCHRVRATLPRSLAAAAVSSRAVAWPRPLSPARRGRPAPARRLPARRRAGSPHAAGAARGGSLPTGHHRGAGPRPPGCVVACARFALKTGLRGCLPPHPRRG